MNTISISISILCIMYWHYYSESKFESCIIVNPSHYLLLWLPSGDALLEFKLALNATTGQRLGSWPADTNPYGWAGRASPAPSQISGSSSPMQFLHTRGRRLARWTTSTSSTTLAFPPHRDDSNSGVVAAPSSFLVQCLLPSELQVFAPQHHQALNTTMACWCSCSGDDAPVLLRPCNCRRHGAATCSSISDPFPTRCLKQWNGGPRRMKKF